jgi:hypothetical protein
MTELASKTRSYIIVSDPLTLEADGSTDFAHNLGVNFDEVAVIVVDRIDNTEFDITVTEPDVNTVRIVEGSTEELVVVILGFINDVAFLPTPAANWTVHEFGSLTKGYMYLSAEAALSGGAVNDNFVHNCNRRPQIAVPIITDSLGDDYALTTTIEAGANGLVRIQVANAPATTPGCRVLAFFGAADAPGTPPDVGVPATGILLELSSRTLAFVDVVGDPAVPSVVAAAGNFDFDHNRARTLLGAVPITLLGDDFDLADVAEVGNVLNAVTVANTGGDDAHCLCIIVT